MSRSASSAGDDHTEQPRVMGWVGVVLKGGLIGPTVIAAGSTFTSLFVPATYWFVQKIQITLPVFASRQNTNEYSPSFSPSPMPTQTRPLATQGEDQPAA